MAPLEPKRMIADEQSGGLKIMFNLARKTADSQRVLVCAVFSAVTPMKRRTKT